MTTRTHEVLRTRALRAYWIHLGVYGLVNAGLATLNLMRQPDNLWFLWVLGGWGLGVLLHTALLFFRPGGVDGAVDRRIKRLRDRGALPQT